MDKASRYFARGQKHAAAALILYEGSHDYGRRVGVPEEDLAEFAFRGDLSLSVFYLIGLSLELILKAAFLAGGGTEKDARRMQHDLRAVLSSVEDQGFNSQSDHLRAMVDYLATPYQQHAFRYEDVGELPLPSDMEQVKQLFVILQDEVARLMP